MARQGNGAAYLMSNLSQGCPFTNYPYTISIWHYKPASTASYAVFGYGSSSINTYSMMYSSGTALYLYINGTQDGNGWNTSVGWNHYAWRCASSTDRSIIINGSVVNLSTSISMLAGLNRYGVMCSPQSTPTYYMGSGERVAELGIWNANISNTDLISIYTNKMSPLMLSRNSLVTYCPLNDGDGGARDLIGGRNLTESGIATLVDHPPFYLYKRSLFRAFSPQLSLSSYNSIFHGSVF